MKLSYLAYTRVEWKIMATVRYFCYGLIHRGTTFMYLQYNRPLFITFCQMFGRRRTPSARPSFLMFSIDRPIARVNSSLVLYWVPQTLAKRSWSHGLISGEYGACSRISHCQRRKRSVTAAVVWLLALSWRSMYHQVLHAVPENILVYYELVPLQFWSRNVALVL